MLLKLIFGFYFILLVNAFNSDVVFGSNTEATLFIIVYDSKTSGNNLNFETEEKLIDLMRNSGLDNIHIMKLDNTSESDIDNGELNKSKAREIKRLKKLIDENSTLTFKNIFIATHGSTVRLDSTANVKVTTLAGIGGFLESGTFGYLRNIFSLIKNNTSPAVHIFLNSCTTLCGSDEEVEARFRGIVKDLPSVKSIWGTANTISGVPTNHEQADKIINKIKNYTTRFNDKMYREFLKVAFLSSGSMYLLALSSNYDHHDILISISIMLGLEYIVYRSLTKKLTKSLEKFSYEGKFLQLDKEGVSVKNTKYYERISIKGPESCSKSLQKL